MPRSILLANVSRHLQQIRKRKRIADSKWTQRFRRKRTQKRKVTIGTWNTRQLGATHSYFDQELKLAAFTSFWNLRKWEIVCLTDTKLGSSSILETTPPAPNTWTIISRGKVSIALNPAWTQAWRSGNYPIHTDGLGAQCRIMLLQLPCYSKLGLALLAAYAPSATAAAQVQQDFLSSLQRILTLVQKKFTIILAGDFNAEVGTRTNDTELTLGPHGPTAKNSRGQQLIAFCQLHGLAIANTWTPQTHKATWFHPRFHTEHLLDYFITPVNQVSNLFQVLTLNPRIAREHRLPDWSEYTDHYPVELQIKIAPPRSSATQQVVAPKPATHKGRGNSPEAKQLRQQYEAAILQALSTVPPPLSWSQITEILTQTATQIFGICGPRPCRPWLQGYQQEILTLSQHITQAKSHLQQVTLQTHHLPHNPLHQHNLQQAKLNLNAAKRTKKRRLTQLENEYWDQLGQQAAEAEQRNDPYQLYSLITKLQHRSWLRTKTCLRNTSQNPQQVAAAWQQHFKNIQNGAIPVAERVWRHIPVAQHTAGWLTSLPTKVDILHALQKMKFGKAPGVDGITVEMLKWAPTQMIDEVCSLVQHIWSTTTASDTETITESWPDSWLQATVIPLWKKKFPKENKNNWRGVVLLSIGSKLVARLVASRLQKFSESFLDEEQQGFRRNRSVDDVLQVTRRIAEEVCTASAGEAVHLTLYDIEKAYPRVNREALWQILHKRGAPLGFIKLCQGLHEHTKFHIKINGVTSRPYETDRGLKEGCPSSPPLFNIYHNAVMTDFRARRKRAADQLQLYPGIPWKAIVNGRIKRRRRTFQTDKNSKIHIFGDIEFADDTATLATAAELESADALLDTTFQDWGEKINRAKTESLIWTPGAKPEPRNATPRANAQARHVGGILTDTNSQWKDTLHRCHQAKIRIKQVANAWSTGPPRSRGYNSRVKLLARLRVMRSVIIPTLTAFGRSRTWTNGQIAALQVVQNQALQRVFGLTRRDLRERHITNAQLHQATRWPTVRVLLMRATLRWLGHIARMPVTRLPKIALFGAWVHKTRAPTLVNTQIRWINKVLQTADIHHLEFFRLAQNVASTKWEALIQRAFPVSGLTRQEGHLLNSWRPGHPLPQPITVRRRQTRTVWTPKASEIPPLTCPVCTETFPTTAQLHHHYLTLHAITDPNLTTFQIFQCAECRRKFTTSFARATHQCTEVFVIPNADSTNKHGQRPLHIPNIARQPNGWTLFTDGSFHPDQPHRAGWGVAVYDEADIEAANCLFELYAPVVLDPDDQRFLGAQQASNNTGELTAIAEALIWLNTEAPGPSDAPAQIMYDSQYAANITTGLSEPHANYTLAQKCHELYLQTQACRPLRFQWVKGHSNNPGNDQADLLADKGRAEEYCTHSSRWAQPPQFALTEANAEKCRKCGRLFLSARRCARHERDCEGLPDADIIPTFPCRLCNIELPSRKHRDAHQAKCQGSVESNTQCRYCDMEFDTFNKRIRHEGLCPNKQAQSQATILWTCPQCGWKILSTPLTPAKLFAAKDRHTQHCKGSTEANCTCTKCGSRWKNMQARLAHETQCAGSEEAKRTCRCCQRIFNTVSGRVGHEKRRRQAGLL